MPERSRLFLPANEIRRLLATARAAAAAAGALLARRVRAAQPPAARRKGVGDFVTAVDLAVEAQLRRRLRAAHPDHGFLGEEGGADRPDADLIWVVDPVDGTSNLSRGLQPTAISLACLHRGQPVAAAVFCLPEAVVYSAARGLGAFRSRRRLAVPRSRLGPDAILGVQWLRGPRRLDFLPALLDTGSRIRNLGCTVAQLCDVAMGRLDANIQEQGKIWDVAAAGLVVEEAGARFTDWSGKPIFPFATLEGRIDHPSVAAWGATHRRLVTLLRGRQRRS